MSLTGQSGTGKIRLFHDFCGPELPIAGTTVVGASGGGMFKIGPFKITGSTTDTDGGIVALEKASGYARISASATSDADGMCIGTDLCFSPVLNGPMVLECRVENYSALTLRNIFIGFAGANADEIAEPLTSSTTTITYVTPVVGFHLDSTINNPTYWHMPYLLSTTATQLETAVLSSQVAVAGESDVLRVEIDPNGAARWYINGKLEQSVGAGLAATTTTKLCGIASIFGKTTTAACIDIDYLLVEANRDWTR